MEHFIGSLLAFDKKDESGDSTAEETVVIEVTTNERGGEIEIAFDDRNERVYLKFRLADFIAALTDVEQTTP